MGRIRKGPEPRARFRPFFYFSVSLDDLKASLDGALVRMKK